MKRFINFGSIKQMRDVIRDISHQARYQGLDENGEPIYKEVKLPVVRAIGTEKIHGTNAAVCYSNPDGFWVQSRKNIITPEKDNAGCAFDAYSKENIWMSIINYIAMEHGVDLDTHIVSVFYEWSGGNIQKNSCVSGCDKMAFIFQYAKISPIQPQSNEEDESSIWVETKGVDVTEKGIYNVMNFPHLEIEIDFENPHEIQQYIKQKIDEIEECSPIGKYFGFDSNIGEGFVFTLEYKGNIYRFKAKGEKHSEGSGKVKKFKEVDIELENKKIEFVNNIACQEFRLDQMFTEIQNSKYNGDVMQISNKDIGDYLRLVIKDVIKEHTEDLVKADLEPKMVNGMISKVAKIYFMERLDKDQL